MGWRGASCCAPPDLVAAGSLAADRRGGAVWPRSSRRAAWMRSSRRARWTRSSAMAASRRAARTTGHLPVVDRQHGAARTCSAARLADRWRPNGYCSRPAPAASPSWYSTTAPACWARLRGGSPARCGAPVYDVRRYGGLTVLLRGLLGGAMALGPASGPAAGPPSGQDAPAETHAEYVHRLNDGRRDPCQRHPHPLAPGADWRCAILDCGRAACACRARRRTRRCWTGWPLPCRAVRHGAGLCHDRGRAGV